MSKEQESFNDEMQSNKKPNESVEIALDESYSNIHPETNSNTYFYAGFWMRFWAYLLDLIVIGSLERLIIKPIFRSFDLSFHDPSIFAPFAILTALTFYLYFILMTKYFGQTIGKMIFGLKVISLKEKKLTWGTIIFRECIGRFISVFTKILYILVAFTPKKQGIHDIFADTSVIHERSTK